MGFSYTSLHEIDGLLPIEQHDPVFDAVSTLQEMERKQMMWGRESNHEVVSSCVVLNFDLFPFAYDQFRARINAEKMENYWWTRGWVRQPHPGVKRWLPEKQPCEACKKEFRPNWSQSRFCSIKCSASRFIKLETCKSCRTQFRQLDRPNARNGYCSVACGNRGREKVRVTFNGETKGLMEWSRITGISYKALENRHANGWDVERMLTTPMKLYKPRVKA